jgi:DNA-binding GntR family transcriptional regulator
MKRRLNLKSLKEQVYDYLREELRRGTLRPGEAINSEETARSLGVSRTPLRDALIQLAMEGFVTIYPRRGVQVTRLTPRQIKNAYEIIGTLESSALGGCFGLLRASGWKQMQDLNTRMAAALEADDFDRFYALNLRFHDTYLAACGNEQLAGIATTLKKRLYDFPRQKSFVREWEERSLTEHTELVRLIREGAEAEAARYIREVHWSYAVQEPYIRVYYPDIYAAGREEKPSG